MAKNKKNTWLWLLAAGAAAAAFLFLRKKNKKGFDALSPVQKADTLMAYLQQNKPLNTNTEQYAAALICSIQNSEDATLFLKQLQTKYNTEIETIMTNFSKSMQQIIEQDWNSKNINIRKINILKDVADNVKKQLMM